MAFLSGTPQPRSGGTIARLRRDLDSGQSRAAGQLLHALRGVAGSVGAGAVHDRARDLELRLEKGEAISDALEPLHLALEHVVQAIRQALAAGAAPAAPESAEAQADPEVLRRLLAYLDDHDSEAVDYLMERAESVRARFGDAAAFRAFESAVNQFDFAAAAQQLRPVVERLA